MRTIHQEEVITIPENVKVFEKCRVVTVKGPKGTIVKDFSHAPVQIVKKGNKLSIGYWSGDRKQCALVRTVYSKIRNMIKGVTKGFLYRMRSASAHFPILVVISDDKKTVEVRNFLGEKRARIIHLARGVTATKSTTAKDEIILRGIDNEMVGMSAAQIHQSILVKRKDIRFFLDGIYVSEKSTISE